MRKTMWRLGGNAAIPLWIIAVLATGCARETPIDAPPEAIVRLSDQFSSDFSLIDQNGAGATDEDFRGKIAVVYFGFATCPDVCPLALGTLSASLNELSEAERAEIAPLFITVDPERDTTEILKSYLAFDDRIIGLTGSPTAIEAARSSFKVYARKQKLPDSALDYTMDHSSLFYVVDREGRPQLAVKDSVTPEQLAAILRRAIKGRLT